MGNIVSYVAWRGDIGLEERSFNEVDNLVLAQLAYVDFTDIVPVIGTRFITVTDAYQMMLERGGVKAHSSRGSLSQYSDLMEKMANSKRFGNARLSCCADILDEQRQIQFAALHIALDDGTTYISFRGTDQSILGWREDFTMSFQTVPAQQAAVRYLSDTIMPGQKYRIGGHSKGGHLAVYASMLCHDDQQEQIIAIYNNDGPGLSTNMIDDERYYAILFKIHRIVPEFSVIGMLFEHKGRKTIVQSAVTGLMQHDAMTWQVEGSAFQEAEDLLPQCKAMNDVFATWIEDAGLEQRCTFTKEFFDALGAGGAKEINQVAAGGIGGFESVLTAIATSDRDTKSMISKLIKAFIGRLGKVNPVELLKEKSTTRGFGILFLGLFFMKLPEHALQIIGTVGVVALAFFAVKRLLFHFSQKRQWNCANRYSIVFYSVAIALLLVFVLQQSVFAISANFCLGILCFSYGFLILCKELARRQSGNKLRWSFLLRATLSILLGLVVMIATGQAMRPYIFTVGSFMIMEGLWEVFSGLYRKIAAVSIKNAA